MELSLFSCSHQHNPTLLHKPLFSIPITRKRSQSNRYSRALPCHCAALSSPDETAKPATQLALQHQGRRALIGSLLTAVGAGTVACDVAEAVSTSRRALRGSKIPETEYTTLPNGLKYYDLKVGSGLKAQKGSRVAVRFTMLRNGEASLS